MFKGGDYLVGMHSVEHGQRQTRQAIELLDRVVPECALIRTLQNIRIQRTFIALGPVAMSFATLSTAPQDRTR
ncbi:protein of unknown function [Candidatus Filomicrobium marinum]|uniref:Uncharacterized protein n=1 Tax=Candidatus Filomicrobium marinum TaxID=1608628 RepID=A0A0D6JBB4_9HYPH|nr:protein of unknown function [Candidatus Filomicrobium marinum]CPR16238.1 protein of unknown function [Candidatus Filomicrobium marinum]